MNQKAVTMTAAVPRPNSIPGPSPPFFGGDQLNRPLSMLRCHTTGSTKSQIFAAENTVLPIGPGQKIRAAAMPMVGAGARRRSANRDRLRDVMVPA